MGVLLCARMPVMGNKTAGYNADRRHILLLNMTGPIAGRGQAALSRQEGFTPDDDAHLQAPDADLGAVGAPDGGYFQVARVAWQGAPWQKPGRW